MTALTWCHASAAQSAAVLLFFSLFLSGTNHESLYFQRGIAQLGNLGGEERFGGRKFQNFDIEQQHGMTNRTESRRERE
jgi:hypothetical protein